MRSLFVICLIVLAACADRTEAPLVPDALSVGTPERIYVGTTRVKKNGVFGIERAPRMTFLDLTVSLPPNREAGTISDGRATPNPNKDFALVAQREFPSVSDFIQTLRRDLSTARTREERDVTVYVHGFNNSFTDAAFRMAQLSHDLELKGPAVSYSWPSRGNPLGYEYDADSALFARDGLMQLLFAVRQAGNNRIVLVGHSMGGRLVMEVLRELELVKPGWAAASMSGVLLISPDVDVDVFRSQAARFTKWPQPFVIFGSQRDRLLRLSASLRGEKNRLGNLEDIAKIADLPIAFVDVSAFDDADAANHFVAGSSGNFLRLIKSSRSVDGAFLEGQTQASISILGSSRKIGKAVTVKTGVRER